MRNSNIDHIVLQVALASNKQEQESNNAEWDARHQEAVDSAEQWKEFADKLSKEKEEQQQQLASASADLQVSTINSAFVLLRLQLHQSFTYLLTCLSRTRSELDTDRNAIYCLQASFLWASLLYASSRSMYCLPCDDVVA